LEGPSRRREALDAAIRGITALQISLPEGPAGPRSRLLDFASLWRVLLEDERRKIEAEAEGAREIPNPVNLGNPVSELNGNIFTGRRDIAAEIERAILGAAQAPTLLLYGQRRMGKTSILNHLPKLLGPDFVPVLVDCQNPAAIGGDAAFLRYV